MTEGPPIRRQRLSRRSWVEAALRKLEQSGVTSVRIDTLAGDMEATKGSFYHHFKNRSELLDAVLDYWKSSALSDVPPLREQTAEAARRRLAKRWRAQTDPETLRRRARLEGSFRDWANRDPEVMDIVRDVDLARLEHYAALFSDMGLSPADARARAMLMQSALMGIVALTPTLAIDFANRRVEAIGRVIIDDK